MLRCDDCAVEKGKKGVTVEIARGRMLRQAKALFDQEQIDLPGVTLTVNFLQLGDTRSTPNTRTWSRCICTIRYRWWTGFTASR